jgi:hypothetical protein
LSLSGLGRSSATGRLRDVQGITLLALEAHLVDEDSHHQVGLIGCNYFITPDFWNERRCTGVVNGISRRKFTSHDKYLSKEFI